MLESIEHGCLFSNGTLSADYDSSMNIPDTGQVL